MTHAENELRPDYKNPDLPVEQRVADLLGRMTLEEKIDQLSGENYMDTRRNERLGIPSLKMTDGPHGVRWEQATCFPTAISLGASWDTNLVREVGVALADETRAKGRNVLLGPCVNIHRTPLGGRNFESFAEDPYLAGRMAVAYVQGVQSRKIGTSTKHFAVNNQEWDRMTIDVLVDERTLHEIYLPAFKAAVQEADTWTVMAAYNRVNGPYCCANKPLLTDILKGEFGFKGLVVSDWGACHGTVDSAQSGLDLEMPGPGQFFGKALLEAVQKGEVSEQLIDDKVRRILWVMFRMDLFDGIEARHQGSLDTPAHRSLAREAGAKGMVLLKNHPAALPLDRTKIKTLAIIGPHAKAARLGGGGSSTVSPFYAVTPFEGLSNKLGQAISLRYVQGCSLPGELMPIPTHCLIPPSGEEGVHGLLGEYFNNQNLKDDPVLKRLDAAVDFDWGNGSPAPEIPNDHFSVRWTGKLAPTSSGHYDLGMTSDDGFRLFLDGRLLIDSWHDQAGLTKTASVELEAGHVYDLKAEYFENTGSAMARLGWIQSQDTIQEAADAARGADAAIVFAGISSQQEGEGFDRQDLNLPGDQNALIEAVAAANPNTIVVLNNGTPVIMTGWIDRVAAVLEAWYPGQEGGNAIADVLLGDVNPSGRLPVTFPRKLDDAPSQRNYPGQEGSVRYAEGLFVGYRHYDSKAKDVLFPFGHGLSYTTFEYSDLGIERFSEAASATVRLTVRNAGTRAGAEIVQLYVHDIEAGAERPEQELKAFHKISLKPGESEVVEFQLDRTAFAFYDTVRHDWVVEPGDFEVRVGASSRDIRARASMSVAKD
ncbi:MAG TPA: glycosyl hydrolase [Verrucomicrobia bacterium]|nr:glycosyl hydrolase [Verrucomicrobiota bacterium]